MFPQMMANNLYSYLENFADPEHPLHGAVLKEWLKCKGMF